MTRYHPRSPGARLSALRRALWDEDRAHERLTTLWQRWTLTPTFALLDPGAWGDADAAYTAAQGRRMEAERDLWEARAGHGLD